ncbi:MAG TPA: immunoglobulin domain-containing protein, partial [Candidatus Acidoferrum sp.]|nr:immunoglobulin domain-containing protein [Candidatus Acidoferrum sp.]
ALAQQTLGAFTPKTTGDLYFGVRPYGGGAGYRFVGLMDEVSLYNRALSVSDIQAIYNAGTAGKCAASIPPFISTQPKGQTAGRGSTVLFSVTAGGSAPLSYQWHFNGAVVPGSTSSILTLTNVQPTNGGTYFVVITNPAGAVTSSNAQLVIRSTSPCSQTITGLVGWWAGEANASDSAGTNDGILEGGVGFATGEVGQAFALNGTNTDVRVPASATLNLGLAAGITIEAWINPSSVAQGRPLVEWNDGVFGVNFWIAGGASSGDGSLYINVKDTSLGDHYFSTAAGLLATNAWQHVAVTYIKNTGLTTLYINGVPLAQQTLGVFTPKTTGDLYFGLRPYGGGAGMRFVGLMDEVSVYNRALSAGQIRDIYNVGAAGKCGLSVSIQSPPSDQTVELASNATFAVTAAGLTPLAYQWFSGPTPIRGATNQVFSLTNVGFAQAGSYSVVITNSYSSATGGPAVLSVVDTTPPTIISCASNSAVSVGGNCVGVLPDLTEQVLAWDVSGPVTVTQSPAPGALLGLGTTNLIFTVRDSSGNASTCTSSLSVADTTPPFVSACVLQVNLDLGPNCQALLPDLTTTNYIIASDNCSGVSISQAPSAGTAIPVGTNTVLLTVSDASSNQTVRAVEVIVAGAPQILSQPTNSWVVVTSNATLSVSACGTAPLVYQWQHACTNLPGANNPMLLLSNVSTNDAGSYQVVITNSSGCATSLVAVLTVLRPPVIARQPRSLAAVPGGTANFSVAAQGLTPFAYQWEKNASAISGQTKAALALTNIQAQDFATYTVVVTNADGMATSTPAALTLAVSPAVGSLGWNSGTFMLNIPTEIGPTYVLEYKNSLQEVSWTTLTTVAGTGSPIPVTDNGLTNWSRFYRVRLR